MSTFSAEPTESTEPTSEPDDAEVSDGGQTTADASVAAVEEPAAEVEAPDTDAEPADDVEELVAEAGDESAEGEEPAEGAEPAAADTEGEENVIEGEALIETQAPAIESAYDKPGKWYVVHTQSGYEKKVKQNIEARASSMNMEEAIHEVVIPMEDVMEFRNGKKVVVQKKVFPGYLLVRCRLTDDAWYVVRNTPGVTGFVGAGNKPSPLPRKDVEAFLQTKPEGEEIQKPTKPRLAYEMDETVRVKEGPFADFSGQIIEINEDQLKVKVLVNIFGRDTPVELEFAQVAKL